MSNNSPAPMRIRASRAADMTEVRVLMSHIMETGQRHDDAGKLVPAHYITDVQVRHVNAQGTSRLVLSADWSTAIAQNPFFVFRFKGGASGEKIVVQWTDNLGARREDEARIL